MRDAVTGKEIKIDDYMGLIKQQALFCWHRMPPSKSCEFEDLLAEGYLVFCELLKTYDPSRGCKFITPLTLYLMHHFGAILSKAHRRSREGSGRMDVYEIDPVDLRPENSHLLAMFYNRLSRTAFLVARELLEASGRDPANISRRPKHARDRAFAAAGVPRSQRAQITTEIRMALSMASSMSSMSAS